jgi:hypothetical protein
MTNNNPLDPPLVRGNRKSLELGMIGLATF